MPRVLPILTSLLLAGCFDFTSDEGEIALDYRIDRPRVLGIRLDPPIVLPGEPVTAHALAWAPGSDSPDAVEVAVCGLREDIRVRVGSSPACFTNPDLVSVVGTSLPATWTPPDLTGIPCEAWDTDIFMDTGGDTGMEYDSGAECQSIPALMVTATFGEDAGRAIIAAHHRLRPLRTGEPRPRRLHSVSRTLVWRGEAVPGGEVELELTLWDEDQLRGFYWYVDGGTLLKTGLTRAQSRTANSVRTDNILRIPDDWRGPLRVAVVVAGSSEYSDYDPVDAFATGNATWETLTLDVQP